MAMVSTSSRNFKITIIKNQHTIDQNIALWQIWLNIVALDYVINHQN